MKNQTKKLIYLNKLNEQGVKGFPKYLGSFPLGVERTALVLKDMEGVTLKDLLTENHLSKQLTQTEFLEIWIKVIKLLWDIHKSGFIYCNLEPEHIFVDISTYAFDDNLIKSQRQDILEWNIDSLISSLNISSRSVKVKSSSERKKTSQIYMNRSFEHKRFNVRLIIKIIFFRYHYWTLQTLKKYLLIQKIMKVSISPFFSSLNLYIK